MTRIDTSQLPSRERSKHSSPSSRPTPREPTSAPSHMDSLPNSAKQRNGKVDVKSYAEPFMSFMTDNPTVFHAVASVTQRLKSHGFVKLSERDSWIGKLSKGGKYFYERNGSSIIAFTVGKDFVSGNGASVIASHIDALTARLKPIPTLSTKAGYMQLGVAPYAGGLNGTWWDRDLGIGGRVLVRNSKTGKIESRLVKLGWPIARIPTLAPHFGTAASLTAANKETEMVPIIGLEDTDSEALNSEDETKTRQEKEGAFAATQPKRLVKLIASELGIEDCEIMTDTSLYQSLTSSRYHYYQLGTRALRYSAGSTRWPR